VTDTLDYETQDSARPTNNLTAPRWLLATSACVIALVAGCAGAAMTHLAFPAQRGPVGHTGPAGPTGPAGKAGTDGSSATLDTNKIGYCFSVSTQYKDVTWVDDVQLFAPTSNNGTLSCPVGSFVSLTPTGPDGSPIKNYDASRKP
jgi:hypothetical protein